MEHSEDPQSLEIAKMLDEPSPEQARAMIAIYRTWLEDPSLFSLGYKLFTWIFASTRRLGAYQGYFLLGREIKRSTHCPLDVGERDFAPAPASGARPGASGESLNHLQ